MKQYNLSEAYAVTGVVGLVAVTEGAVISSASSSVAGVVVGFAATTTLGASFDFDLSEDDDFFSEIVIMFSQL